MAMRGFEFIIKSLQNKTPYRNVVDKVLLMMTPDDQESLALVAGRLTADYEGKPSMVMVVV
jgi:hypothetical protein